MLSAERRDQTNIVANADKFSKTRQRHLPMFIALALLLTSLLVLVVGTDWQFWRSAMQSAWSEIAGRSGPATTAQSTPSALPQPRPKRHKQIAAQSASDTQAPTSPPNRPVTLAPLEVEVIAHGTWGQTVRTRNTAINLDLQDNHLVPRPEGDTRPDTEKGVTDASEQSRISPETAQLVSNPVRPIYPLLAKQMKVHGSVVLQAHIGKDGEIQDLQVLKGPEILSGAAVEAVKQWRFKPHFQAGQPIEADAQITVYFTIATH